MRYLDLDEILTVDDLREQDVAVPEWGKDAGVRIRGFSVATRQHIQNAATVNGELDGGRMTLLAVVYGVVTPKMDESHAEALRHKSSAAIERIARAVLSLNKMLPEEARADEATFLPGDGVGGNDAADSTAT